MTEVERLIGIGRRKFNHYPLVAARLAAVPGIVQHSLQKVLPVTLPYFQIEEAFNHVEPAHFGHRFPDPRADFSSGLVGRLAGNFGKRKNHDRIIARKIPGSGVHQNGGRIGLFAVKLFNSLDDSLL